MDSSEIGTTKAKRLVPNLAAIRRFYHSPHFHTEHVKTFSGLHVYRAVPS